MESERWRKKHQITLPWQSITHRNTACARTLTRMSRRIKRRKIGTHTRTHWDYKKSSIVIRPIWLLNGKCQCLNSSQFWMATLSFQSIRILSMPCFWIMLASEPRATHRNHTDYWLCIYGGGDDVGMANEKKFFKSMRWPVFFSFLFRRFAIN